MDDRDFIYWVNGVFESSKDVLEIDQVDQIMENICDVYDTVQNNGVINDFDSMRVIALIEGALMYYDDLPHPNKQKITRLIKNEIEDSMSRFRDKSKEKMPLFKDVTKEATIKDIKIIPLDEFTKNHLMDLLSGNGKFNFDFSQVITEGLSEGIGGNKSATEKSITSALESLEKLLLGPPKKLKKKAVKKKLKPSEDEDEDDTPCDEMDEEFESQQDGLSESSLNSISEKIAQR